MHVLAQKCLLQEVDGENRLKGKVCSVVDCSVVDGTYILKQ